jgi:hypothetical protein
MKRNHEYRGVVITWDDERKAWEVGGRFFYDLRKAKEFVREEVVWDRHWAGRD